MKFGFDIGGVIDRDPVYFKELFDSLIKEGHEVHIVTGKPFDIAEKMLSDWGLQYTEFFSIVDHHREEGTKGIYEESTGWWMPEDVWMSSKGDYAVKAGLHAHMDDQREYIKWWPWEFYIFLALVTDDISPSMCWEGLITWMSQGLGIKGLENVKGVE